MFSGFFPLLDLFYSLQTLKLSICTTGNIQDLSNYATTIKVYKSFYFARSYFGYLDTFLYSNVGLFIFLCWSNKEDVSAKHHYFIIRFIKILIKRVMQAEVVSMLSKLQCIYAFLPCRFTIYLSTFRISCYIFINMFMKINFEILCCCIMNIFLFIYWCADNIAVGMHTNTNLLKFSFNLIIYIINPTNFGTKSLLIITIIK